MVIGGATAIAVGSVLTLTLTSLSLAHGRSDWQAAFYHAENALQWGAQLIADSGNNVGGSNYYSTADSPQNMPPYMTTAIANGRLAGAWVSIVASPAPGPSAYFVTAEAQCNAKVSKVQALVTYHPASPVFDYEYFLNNWGWWWGGTITGDGAERSNWNFDFRGGPVLNGTVLASGDITSYGNTVNLTKSLPFLGEAAGDAVDMVFSNVERVDVPNLTSFNPYITNALANPYNGIWVGTNQIVQGVWTNTAQPGLYLTQSNGAPIIVSNTAVIPGDVVIQGSVSGHGTIYVGGNLYVAGNVAYANGPDFSVLPETQPPAARDQWALSNLSKDLVAFAVRGSVVGGDVTSSHWVYHCYNGMGGNTWGMQYCGDERTLGADGIPHTADDNVPYPATNGWANASQYVDAHGMTTAFDADGDGFIRGPYNYDGDFNMTSSRAALISGYPVNANSTPLAFSQLASPNIAVIEGIYYCNHGLAMLVGAHQSSAAFHGTVVSRDEAIVSYTPINFIYDSRIHSRYHNDRNSYIDLGLPYSPSLLQVSNFQSCPRSCPDLMFFTPISKLSVAPLRLSWALLVLGLGVTVIGARAATQIPVDQRQVSDKDRIRMTQEQAWRLQREQVAAALAADRHQKAVRHFLMAGVNARARQRAVEISRQLGSRGVLAQPASSSRTHWIMVIVLLVGGVSFFRWRRSRVG